MGRLQGTGVLAQVGLQHEGARLSKIFVQVQRFCLKKIPEKTFREERPKESLR